MTYDLYLESGPNHNETMVHVLSLPGCMLTSPTTAEALAEAPAVIRAFLRLLQRHGQEADIEADFETNIVGHNTEWDTTGYEFALVTLPSELTDLSDEGIEERLHWIRWLSGELGAWASSQSSDVLDAAPADGAWPARTILLHVLESQPAYVERILQTPFGFEETLSEVGNGRVSIEAGLRRACDVIAEGIAAATQDQRRNRITFDEGEVGTLNRALRRTAEHSWEHLLELSRRPGGPYLGFGE